MIVSSLCILIFCIDLHISSCRLTHSISFKSLSLYLFVLIYIFHLCRLTHSISSKSLSVYLFKLIYIFHVAGWPRACLSSICPCISLYWFTYFISQVDPEDISRVFVFLSFLNWFTYFMLQVDPEHVSRVLSMARMARLHTLGLHHQKEDFRVVTQHNQKTTTNTMTKKDTFREHHQRAILETWDLWDIWSEWWGDMTWPTKRQWQRQRQRQWQRQIHLENTFNEQS